MACVAQLAVSVSRSLSVNLSVTTCVIDPVVGGSPRPSIPSSNSSPNGRWSWQGVGKPAGLVTGRVLSSGSYLIDTTISE